MEKREEERRPSSLFVAYRGRSRMLPIALQNETRNPSSIQRLPCVRSAGISCWLITPKFLGLLMLTCGSKKLG